MNFINSLLYVISSAHVNIQKLKVIFKKFLSNFWAIFDKFWNKREYIHADLLIFHNYFEY